MANVKKGQSESCVYDKCCFMYSTKGKNVKLILRILFYVFKMNFATWDVTSRDSLPIV